MLDPDAWDKFQTKCYEISSAHGFHEDDATGDDIKLERWQFTSSLCRVHSEVSEAQDWVQRGKSFTEIWLVDGKKPEGVPIELADAIIRIADMAATYGIDLADAINLKMEYNMTRPFKHGKVM